MQFWALLIRASWEVFSFLGFLSNSKLQRSAPRGGAVGFLGGSLSFGYLVFVPIYIGFYQEIPYNKTLFWIFSLLDTLFLLGKKTVFE